MSDSNHSRWIAVYTDQLIQKYGNNTQWLARLPSSLKRNTPAESLRALAEKITSGLPTHGASKDSDAIKLTCKTLGIKHTYKAIQEFLTTTPMPNARVPRNWKPPFNQPPIICNRHT